MKKSIILAVGALLITSTQALAMNVNFNKDTNTVTVSGVATANEHLAIVVGNNTANEIEKIDESNSIGFYEANADSEGNYSVSFKATRTEGVINVFVSGNETTDKGSVEWYSESTVVNMFNTMINKIQVYELVGKMQNVYGGTSEIYSKYFNLKNTDSIDKAVYDNKPYSSLSGVYSIFSTAVENYNPPAGGSTGGGGGGGGGGGVIIHAGNKNSEEKTPTQNVEQNQAVEEKKQVFVDVAPSFWGYEAIDALYKEGIISGVGNDEFEPNAPITREAFVKMIVEMIGMDVSNETDTFVDSDKSAWYSPYLAVAQKCDLVYGREDGSFGVGEILTRQDMAVLSARVIGTSERGETVKFADDSEISDYAKNSIEILCGLNIMSGIGNGNFAPKDTATRAQAAKVIYEISKIIR